MIFVSVLILQNIIRLLLCLSNLFCNFLVLHPQKFDAILQSLHIFLSLLAHDLRFKHLDSNLLWWNLAESLRVSGADALSVLTARLLLILLLLCLIFGAWWSHSIPTLICLMLTLLWSYCATVRAWRWLFLRRRYRSIRWALGSLFFPLLLWGWIPLVVRILSDGRILFNSSRSFARGGLGELWGWTLSERRGLPLWISKQNCLVQRFRQTVTAASSRAASLSFQTGFTLKALPSLP